MNLTELQTAAFGDAHREDYLTANGARFVAEAEAFIFMRLASYGLEATLNDAARVSVGSNVYNLPSKTVQVRHVIYNNVELDPVDETFVAARSTLSQVVGYVVRPLTIAFAGTPALTTTLAFHYFGLPAALVNPTDTNTLLNDYPQLYKRAIQISIYERAQNWEAHQKAKEDTVTSIDQINRKVKKMLGGARSSNPYNVEFRSSY
jgi:hypothetical protein